MVPRQVEFNSRSFPDLAVNLDVAARLLDEAVDLRKSKARALPDVLSGEKRIKSLCSDLRSHADASISDGKQDVLTGQHFRLCRGIDFVEMDVGRLNGQLAA